MSQHYDAVVIGAGPAGSTAALLLASRGWSVLLVEAKAFPRRKVCGEYLSATNAPLLRRLGIAEDFQQQAGPSVTRTAIFCGERAVTAALPATDDCEGEPWGRALSRERLDLLLRDRAVVCGAEIAQPARCESLVRAGDGFQCLLSVGGAKHVREVSASVAIAAHGSWEIGPLATERKRTPPRSSDLLAFKAHFRSAELPQGLMPLLSFADGYGGMTHCDDGRVSLSCCVRRSRVERLPRSRDVSAGDAVLGLLLESCPALRPVLGRAELDGPWLSAGPIQPGIRPRFRDGVFVIGNAAGEAHPVVAEGISMAMQSAWLLCEQLARFEPAKIGEPERAVIGRRYAGEWRRAFGARLRAAAVIAALAMRPTLMKTVQPLLAACPPLLTFGARLSGKSTLVVRNDLSVA